jgi:hypothetical protein
MGGTKQHHCQIMYYRQGCNRNPPIVIAIQAIPAQSADLLPSVNIPRSLLQQRLHFIRYVSRSSHKLPHLLRRRKHPNPTTEQRCMFQITLHPTI